MNALGFFLFIFGLTACTGVSLKGENRAPYQSDIEKEIGLILDVLSKEPKNFKVSGARLTLLDVKFLELP